MASLSDFEDQKMSLVAKVYQQCLYETAMQLILRFFSLQLTVFTSLKSNNDFRKKEQFIVHVCFQESNRKGLQFDVTRGTCSDSYSQNMTVFPVKWTHFYLEEKN